MRTYRSSFWTDDERTHSYPGPRVIKTDVHKSKKCLTVVFHPRPWWNGPCRWVPISHKLQESRPLPSIDNINDSHRTNLFDPRPLLPDRQHQWLSHTELIQTHPLTVTRSWRALTIDIFKWFPADELGNHRHPWPRRLKRKCTPIPIIKVIRRKVKNQATKRPD